ncbi:MAG: recombinase RecT [Acetatifactor sp.]|nr:recombinase RecT [Acetatifactor sp.]
MATKAELAEAGKQQAGLVVNNSFVDGLVTQLREKEKFGLTFPKDYNYSNELMGAYLILKETTDTNKKPVLESCSQVSIANTLMDMVTLGVSMQKKQCYPVAYGGKLQCQISVYGNTCIARRYGLKTIDAMCIYEGDEFKYHIENARIVIDSHTQDFLHINKDKIVGAYAVVTMDDGSQYVEIMSIDMIKQAWKQGFGYKEDGIGTHQKFTDQMCLKTVKNRALKYIIRTTHGTQAESDAYDNFEETETDDRVSMDVQHDIEENANSVIFDPTDEAIETVDDPKVVEEKAPFED